MYCKTKSVLFCFDIYTRPHNRFYNYTITKAVSRFARNVKETLEIVRELKKYGVAVRFEKEGIDTLNIGDEMLLNTFSAIAQEESISISQNVRIGNRNRMAVGEFIVSNAAYGFRYVNQKLEIFETYIAGATLKDIADRLTAQQVVYSEKKTEWNKARVMRILDNVKYLGDETFPQIIDERLFAEASRQKTARQKTTPADSEQEIHVLKGYIVCGKCGCVMKRRVEKKCKYKERWYCSNPECDNNVHIRDTTGKKHLKIRYVKKTFAEIPRMWK